MPTDMKKQYSVVTYLEGEAKAEVRALQEKLAEVTGSRECLDSWQPHLTVGDGPTVTDAELSELEAAMRTLTETETPFSVTLAEFGEKTDRKGGAGEITTPYVLHIKVQVNPALERLVARIEREITSQYELWYHMPQPYAPHVTLAFRDLTEEGFYTGRKFLANMSFAQDIEINHVALVEKRPDADVEHGRFYFTHV